MLLFTQRSLKMQLIIIFISAFGLCNAQVQISNFPNDTLKKPNSFDLKFSTKTKAYFTAFKPEAGNELWVTDGTKDGTFMLDDFHEGSDNTSFSSFVEAEGNVLFIQGGNIIWTYNENENLLDTIKWDFQKYENLILTFKKKGKVYFLEKGESSYSIYEVDLLNKQATKVEQNVISYCFDDDRLIFSKKSLNEGFDYFDFDDRSKPLFNLVKRYTSISVLNGIGKKFLLIKSDGDYPSFIQDLKIIHRFDGKYKIEDVGGTA
jgi:ELWxxDGT repeat protein